MSHSGIPKTPGRASFAGVVEQVRSSPWRFKDLASQIMPTDREKALKHAIINALAILLVIFFMATLYGINAMLMPFFRPLLLALLFGSFLHPMKRSLSATFKQVFVEICEDDVPIIAGLTMPLKLFDRVTTRMVVHSINYTKSLITYVGKTIKGDLTSTLSLGLGAVSLAAVGGDSLVKFVIFINLITLIRDTNRKDISLSDAYLHFLIRSFVLVQICWLHSQIMYLLLPIVVILKLLLSLFRILYATLRAKLTEKLNLLEISDLYTYEKEEKEEERDNDTPSEVENEQKSRDVTHRAPKSFSRNSFYIIRNLYKPLAEIFQYIVEQSDGSLDTISSTCVIGLMALIVVFATLFFSFHIYSESAYLIERISISANSIISNNPDLKALLPENFTGVHSLLDGAVKNTYEHGREWIRKSTRQLLNNAALDEFNTTLIEKQMVEFWDRAYVLYTNGSDPLNIALKDDQKPYDWNRLFDALQSLNFTLCAQIFKQNWDTLVSVMDSIVILLKGNLSLATSLITATVSILIMSGSALLNFIMHLVSIFNYELYIRLTNN